MKPYRLFILVLIAGFTPCMSHAGWQFVGEGDCPGYQVIGSTGVEPEAVLCTTEFAGKTALCFTQVCYPGCQYIDVPTSKCTGGSELAQVYTCQPQAGSSGATAK
jgi:hypothetical protein